MTVRLTFAMAEAEELLRVGIETLRLSLEPAVIPKFLFYGDELLKWNNRVNLTGHKSLQQVVVKHFLDSLAVWPWVKELACLADIGTGAGFPGLPLKLALPHLRLTLIEPTGKKTAFLNFVVAHLGLKNVEVRQVYLTAPMARQWGPLFQGVITRATFPLARYVEMGAPLVKPGGCLLALKGPKMDEAEWQEAVDRAQELDLTAPKTWEYTLPLTAEPRLLIRWQRSVQSLCR